MLTENGTEQGYVTNSLSTDLPILSSVLFLKGFHSKTMDSTGLEVMRLLRGTWNATEETRHMAMHSRIREIEVISQFIS